MHQNINARIVADSVNPSGNRLTSFILTYPRFIHAEFMTHRAFSRNAASSRAIPLKKMVAAVRETPAQFEYWGSNQSGMQAGQEIGGEALANCQVEINNLRNEAIETALMLEGYGLHKQNANRYLEPFGHITVLCTAADWAYENFFALRAHPAAQPEFQVLAYRMLDVYLRSKPQQMGWGDWHIPAFTPLRDYGNAETMLKIATARCARLSYLTFEGERDPAKDIELHDRLVASGHWSPFEHCAYAVDPKAIAFSEAFRRRSNFDSNQQVFCGWTQYRKHFDNECRTCNLAEVLASKPAWVNV